MIRVVFFLVMLLPVMLQAQDKAMLILTRDSLAKNLIFPIEDGWRFMEADAPEMADTGYNDSRWAIVNSMLAGKKNRSSAEKFNSVGWFRLHFFADSNITGTPLALGLQHLGASEVYLDGKKIKTFGKINGKDSTRYYSPQSNPFTFVLSNPGHHVLALRYANYAAQHNRKVLNNDNAGFSINIALADKMISANETRLVSLSFTLSMLFGIFLALCLSHLFLYFYNRDSKSNLFFSLFCLGIAVSFLIPWLISTSNDPAIALSSHYIVPFLISLICISLSGFVNDLFSVFGKKFYFLFVGSLVAPFVFLFVHFGIGIICYYIVVGGTMLEASVLIIRALYRKVKGAWIIGAGFLTFALFVLFMVVYLVIFDNLSFVDESVWQVIFAVAAALAILSLPVSMSIYLAWNFASINRRLKANLRQVEELSAKTIEQEHEKNKIIEGQKGKLEEEVTLRTAEVVAQKEKIEKQHDELKAEKEKSDTLLLNILPEEIATELKEKGHSEARSYNHVSVLFTDFVDFTKAAERMSPQELVDELHVCFRTFDEIISRHNIEKIKTIGDAYLAVGGLPVADANHAINTVMAALEIRDFMKGRYDAADGKTFQIRIGINSGSVVAGIVGIKKFAYDIWGDTVNTAARMEQSSEADKINISESTYMLVKDSFICTYRGKIAAKNKGEMNMYFVDGKQG